MQRIFDSPVSDLDGNDVFQTQFLEKLSAQHNRVLGSNVQHLQVRDGGRELLGLHVQTVASGHQVGVHVSFAHTVTRTLGNLIVQVATLLLVILVVVIIVDFLVVVVGSSIVVKVIHDVVIDLQRILRKNQKIA
jgi:hypothetical protein